MKTPAVSTGYLLIREDGHPLETCITLTDDTGMGLCIEDAFGELHKKYARITIEEIEDPYPADSPMKSGRI